MDKVTLKLVEFFNLETELNGVVNPQSGEVLSRGLLNDFAKLSVKYKLNELSKKVSEERQAVEALRFDLIKELGEVDENGNASIKPYLNTTTDEDGQEVPGDVNPKFVEFREKFNELLQSEKEFECEFFSLEELDSIQSSANCPTFFKLVKQ